jgi:hypothetical protein
MLQGKKIPNLKNLIENKESSAIIGLPRLGKTTALNYYAIKIFECMGCDEPFGVRVLLLRIGPFLYHCVLKLENGKKFIKFEEKECENLIKWKSIVENITKYIWVKLY